MSTALTVVERAQVALGATEHEKKLVALAEGSKSIVAITNRASYQECHGARVALMRARVEITKTGKAARDDATAFSKAVIAEEKRLVGIIEPEESRLSAIQTEHDTRVKREQLEKEAAELERVAGIKLHIASYGAVAAGMVGKPSNEIADALAELRKVFVGEWAFEFKAEAAEALSAAIATLDLLLAGTLSQEAAAKAEADRIAAERTELARLRAEQTERDRQAAALRAEEDARQAAARAAIEAEQKAAQAKIEAEREAARAVIRAEQEAERKRVAEAARQEALARQAREEVERVRRQQEQDAIDQKQAQERARMAAELAEADRLHDERRAREEAAAAALRAAQEAIDSERRGLERARAEIMQTDNLIVALREKIDGRKAYAGIARAIDAYLAKKGEKGAA